MTLALVSLASVYAATIDDVKKLYKEGHYHEAIANLQDLIKKSPKDATVNYYMGASYFELGNYKEAIPYLKKAEDAKSTLAAQTLAQLYLNEYDVDNANAHLDRWEVILDKAKKEYPPQIDEMRERTLMIRNFLERVENVQIIDSFEVDSVEFFKNYMLSYNAGELLDGFELPDQYTNPMPKVVYRPQSGKELFWGMTDDSGKTSIVVADVLDDGTIDQPVSIGDEINDGVDADFPFLLEDGSTIYYAATGENSLGGYDIFMTRRSADGEVLQPQNLGMPYNSADNDYMMVIDETNNIGWWASDRNHIPGKVTIYTFVPSKMRINYSPDSPDLRDAALLHGVNMTKDLQERLDNGPEEIASTSNAEFYFPLPNGVVYTQLSQFRNSQARQAMKDMQKRLFELETMEMQLEELRMAYSKGDKKVAPKILALEAKVKEAPVAIQRLSNQIISLETKR